MGLALLIVILTSRALLRDDRVANEAARFWTRIFGLNFVMGVVTGIPMEFQFGTNWARFSEATGGVIGQTPAMEGVFAFFLGSAFLYLLLFQEERLGPRGHWLAAVTVFLGSWLSGFFIVCTNAFMQHPLGHEVAADGTIQLASLSAFLTNPWAFTQYAHTMAGAVVTASFVMASIGAYYHLQRLYIAHAETFLRVGVVVGLVAALAVAFSRAGSRSRRIQRSSTVGRIAVARSIMTTTPVGSPSASTVRSAARSI